MKLVDLLEFVSGVVYLEKEAILAPDVDSFDLGALLEGVWIIIGILEIKYCEDGVSGVVIENYRGAREMLIFHSPKSNVFLTT